MRSANLTTTRLSSTVYIVFAGLLLFFTCVAKTSASASSFILAVIPDTQNYIDFRHQKSEGFNFDGSAIFIDQMEYLASQSVNVGGDVAFVAAVGDVWQHQTKTIDAFHMSRGIDIEPDPILARNAKRVDEVLSFELPKAVEGYRIISEAGIPFGVAPGNHDYDAAWSVLGFPPNRSKKFSELKRSVKDMGILHIGGLDNFRSVFGESSFFFKNKPWYVASYRGGANSAQIFDGAGYQFLHIALEMQPDDSVLDWAESVMNSYPALPTILTTHDFLNLDGERRPNPLVDLVRVDPDNHNSAEQVWEKLIMQNDQIFLVLCGHHHGQGFRVDKNKFGNPVYQILSNYQSRGRMALQFGNSKPKGIGDGWLRLMKFDLGTDNPKISIKTFSTFYNKYSSDIDTYASWYKNQEHPEMTDAQFYAADDFEISLAGFKQRFVLEE